MIEKNIAVFAQSRRIYLRMVREQSRKYFINIENIDNVRGYEWGHIITIGDWDNTQAKVLAYNELCRRFPNIKSTKVECRL